MTSVMPARRRGYGKTSRTDAWWIQPLLTVFVLGGFIVYSTWAAFQNAHFYVGNYLSPFYSPVLFTDDPGAMHHSFFGAKPDFWPALLPFSPALLILPFPALFRFTCYYYRGAYYKAFWADPPNCSVGEPRNVYLGENSLPLILQNLHRYALYFAIAFLFLLGHDAWKAMWFDDGAGGQTFGIGVGTIVLTLNVVFLSGYTLGCHSLRHLVGGYLKVFSTSKSRKSCWDCVTGLNERHMQFAWISLFWVMFSDVYVRLCSMGIWSDWRIL